MNHQVWSYLVYITYTELCLFVSAINSIHGALELKKRHDSVQATCLAQTFYCSC